MRALRAVALAAVLGALGALPAAGPAAARERVHVVQVGESLWSIAAETLDDAWLWPALYRANRDQIGDPRRLHPGQRLTIPSVDPEARDALRREAHALLQR